MKCAVKYKCYRNSKVQTLASVVNLKIHRLIGTYKKLNYICLTEFNKEKLLTVNQIKPEQVFVKPNFVDSDISIIPYNERENQYVFVGRIDKLKGIDILLKAWKVLGEDAPKLIICGTGPMEEWCRNYIDENNLKNVELKGFVRNTEVKKYISKSKALIMCSQWYETFGMVIIEAYSVGVPVIVGDIGNIKDLVIHGKTGVKFMYNSFQALATVIESYQNNLGHCLSEDAHDFYKVNYTGEVNYESLVKIYKEMKH